MKEFNEFETVIIGGGQAGLAVSYYLSLEGCDHIILEQATQAANAWRNHRWKSFTLNTPNWQSTLPGAQMRGKDPDGFLRRDEIISYFEDYVRENQLPIRYGVHVLDVKRGRGGYTVETTSGKYKARNVVVATGLYQRPRIPQFKGALCPEIVQLHSDAYWKPSYLPFGAVLVVGSAQSGAQIAEELIQSGRKVYLSVSGAGRVPRRYRGKDINWWSNTLGLYERTVDQLKSPREKYVSKPHISGTNGGHTLNLHQLAVDGVILLGRVTELNSTRAYLARDLHKNLAVADQFESDLASRIDSFIKMRGLTFPEESLPRLTAGYEQTERDCIDLVNANVTSVIWATGYSFDFSLVHLPVLDADGYPIQQRGVTSYPGLYFLGMPWLHSARSGLIFGVSEDAMYVASHITKRQLSEVSSWSGFGIPEVAYEI
jgi:putative flavoprotein involved in K+ transport